QEWRDADAGTDADQAPETDMSVRCEAAERPESLDRLVFLRGGAPPRALAGDSRGLSQIPLGQRRRYRNRVPFPVAPRRPGRLMKTKVHEQVADRTIFRNRRGYVHQHVNDDDDRNRNRTECAMQTHRAVEATEHRRDLP